MELILMLGLCSSSGQVAPLLLEQQGDDANSLIPSALPFAPLHASDVYVEHSLGNCCRNKV